ncbi:unnamed protein product [Brachionus calyciflorus]|uniref:Uncharacterized protein n=1 Tax=Brachionus calyciflorus TaxID=104777 RepID=A0A813UBS3_9BILA|nr:unnamed protein product [Brachionus calyciflorus]
MYQNPGQTTYINPVGIHTPAVDAYGRPVLVTMNYEQRMAYAHDLRRQQKEYTLKRLQENYPTKFAIIYSIAMIIIGIAAFSLQIVLITNNGALKEVGHGIWGGAYCIYLAVLSLLMIKFRKYCLLILATISHAFGFMIIIMSLVAINGIGFTSYTQRYSRSKGYVTEANTKMIPVTSVMIGLGVVAFILCIVFLILMIKTMNRPPRAIYNQGGTVYPNNLAMPYNMNPVVSYQNNYPPTYNNFDPPPYQKV